MPRPQLIDLDATRGRDFAVDLRLGGLERSTRQLVQLVKQLDEVVGVLLIEIKLKGMKVLEAQLVSGFVAEPDQFFQVRLDGAADRLAGLPDRLKPFGVLGFFQDLAHLAVGHFLAVHLGAVDVECLFHGVRLGDDLLEQGRIDLFFQVLQIEHVYLTGQDRLIDLAALLDFFQLAEFLRVGERLVDSVLSFDLLVKVFILARDVGVPPGQAGGAFERPNLGFMRGHEFARPLGHLGIGPDRPRRGHHPHKRET